jgi:hypothetical protein
MGIQLSRRSFLKGLSTVTFLTFQRINVSSTIEALGEILDKEPLVFNVHHKQLEIANYFNTPNRYDAYGVNQSDIKTKDDLIDYCDANSFLLRQVYEYSQQAFEEKMMEDQSIESLEVLMKKLDSDEFIELLKNVQEWFEEEPWDDDELSPYNSEIISPLNGYDAAFKLFLEGDDSYDIEPNEIADALKISVIEGEHPGSTYYAAELTMSIDEANQLAKDNNYPIRFVEVDYG